MKLHFSNKADWDLGVIYNFVAKDNKERAKHLVNGILDSLCTLEEFPNLGKPLTLLLKTKEEYRSLIVSKKYIAIYYIADNVIVVARIFNEKQNYIRELIK